MVFLHHSKPTVDYNYFHLSSGVRFRYAKFFSDCLVQLQKVVDSKDSGKALIPLNLDLVNFRKLLEDAAFCGNNGTFDLFVRAAMEATFLILYYMPGKLN
jgi:hypothetical protein